MSTSAAEPSGPPPDQGGRFAGWIARRPRTVFWVTLGVALLLGMGIGAAAVDNAEELAAVKDDLSAQTAKADAMEEERDDALADLERATAKGEVPSFIGDYVEDAETSDQVEQFGWKIDATKEPSDKTVGTVIEQSVPEGKVLGRGRTIALTVAVEPPKQWTTIFEESGAGSKRTDEFRIPPGKARINYSFTGDTNAILWLNTPGEEFGDGLLNEIGDYSDSTRIYDAEGIRYLEIEGGQWTVSVQVFK